MIKEGRFGLPQMHIRRFIVLVFLVLVFDGVAAAQNLVPNPSFESYSQCPTALSFGPSDFASAVVAWTSPTTASPDYYNACDVGPAHDGVPANDMGNQAARTGNAYAGLILRPSNNYREYIEVPLTAPLVATVAYQVSFYVSLADASQWGVDKLGAYLSAGSVGPVNNDIPLPVVPQIVNPTGNYITDKTGWTLVSGTYVALGGEDHVVIGNFADNSSTTPLTGLGGFYPGSYYYVDDVSVEGQGTPPVQVQVLSLPPCQTAGLATEADVSTGASIPPGQQDPHWQLIEVPPSQAGAFPAYSTNSDSSWVPPTTPAHWSQRVQSADPQKDSSGNYIYRLQFNLHPALYSNIQISGNYAADNSAVVKLNNVSQTSCSGNTCFLSFHPVSISSGFVDGLNTLDIIVYNNPSWDSNTTNTGLLVEAKLQATCICVAPPSGMVAWWPLDETTGATVVYDIADGNDGTPQAGPVGSGGPTPETGMVAGAMAFDGSSTFVEVPNAPNLNFGTGSLSVDAWIKTISRTGLMPIVDKEVIGFPNTSPYGYTFYIRNGHLGFSMSSDVNATSHGSIGAEDMTHFLADNTWYHVAVTVERNSASLAVGTLFLNGEAITTATFSTLPLAGLTADNTGDLILGSANALIRLSAHAYFNGSIDEIEIFNRALAAGEIEGIYRAGSAGKCKCAQPPSGMAAWWPLDETSGTAIHDIGTHHLDGTAQPAPIGVAGGPHSITGQYVNNSLGFVGSYVDVQDSPLLNFGTGEFSMDGWVSLWGDHNDNGVAHIEPIVDKTIVTGGSIVRGYALYVYFPPIGDPQLAFTLDDGTAAVSPPPTLLDPTPLSAGWHFLAVTVARPNLVSAHVTLYVDGAPWSATIAVSNTDSIGADLWISGSRLVSLLQANLPLVSSIDEVEIFNGVLTPQDILDIYHADTTGKCKPACPTCRLGPVVPVLEPGIIPISGRD